MVDYRPSLAGTTSALQKAASRMPLWLEFSLIIGLCVGQAFLHSAQTLFVDARTVTRVLTDQAAAVNALLDMLAVALTLGLLKARGWKLSDLLPIKPAWSGLFAGLALLAAYRVISIVVYIVLSGINGGPLAAINYGNQLTPLGAIASSVDAAFIEELITLGYVLHVLKDKGAFYAITASTFIRLAVHLSQGPVELAVVVPMGILFGILYWRNRNLWPLLVAHGLFTLITLV